MGQRVPEPGMKQKPWQGVLCSTVVLFLLWLILSGQSHPLHVGLGLMSSAPAFFQSAEASHPLHVGLGLVSAFGVAWLNASADWCPRRFLLFRVVWYLIWLSGRIMRSGLHMTALILHPDLPIAPRLIHYRTNLQQRAAVVLLGNSITLTPGTITAEVNDGELVVHTIDGDAGQDLTSQRFEHQLTRVFGPSQEDA